VIADFLLVKTNETRATLKRVLTSVGGLRNYYSWVSWYKYGTRFVVWWHWTVFYFSVQATASTFISHRKICNLIFIIYN